MHYFYLKFNLLNYVNISLYIHICIYLCHMCVMFYISVIDEINMSS